MKRAFLFVMDSVGIGGSSDAAKFGDEGSDTVGHIAAECAAGRADIAGLRSGPLKVPNMVALGLGQACRLATGSVPPGLEGLATGFFAAAQEISSGKDTPSGHWEIAGQPVRDAWSAHRAIRGQDPGQEVALRWARGDREPRELTLRLGFPE